MANFSVVAGFRVFNGFSSRLLVQLQRTQSTSYLNGVSSIYNGLSTAEFMHKRIPFIHMATVSTQATDTTIDDSSDASFSSSDNRKTRDQNTSTGFRRNQRGKIYNPVDLATSLEYFSSDVYTSTYRGKPVWFYYRRNFKGHFQPPRTRPNCVVAHKLISSNPCPICRDEYLIFDYRHTELLKQFINPISSEVLQPKLTGLCQHQQKILLTELAKAWDLGTIETWFPFRLYNYRDYYRHLPNDHLTSLLKVAEGTDEPYDEVTQESDLAALPTELQDFVKRIQTIPHATELNLKPPLTKIERPHVPNRYHMEETYKKLLAKRRRSRSFILE